MRESWRTVTAHTCYEVSNLGRVRNGATQKVLTPYSDGRGYLKVKLNGKNCRVHILVAIAFCAGYDKTKVVNHKRGKKNDNRASQLEWITQSENITHAWRVLKKCKRSNRNAKSIRQCSI